MILLNICPAISNAVEDVIPENKKKRLGKRFTYLEIVFKHIFINKIFE